MRSLLLSWGLKGSRRAEEPKLAIKGKSVAGLGFRFQGFRVQGFTYGLRGSGFRGLGWFWGLGFRA